MYIENPKTRGSGIVCVIPQRGVCPMRCLDCFFQSGRSYLNPLEKNLPNIPPAEEGRVYRMNDGNDSNVGRNRVVEVAAKYRHAFFNTAIPHLSFPGPVVLTVNPGKMTTFHKVDPDTPNLMMVRVRTSTANLDLVDAAVAYYAPKVPVVLTFLAFFHEPPPDERLYSFRTRTLNSYWCITQEGWDQVTARYRGKRVYTCGRDASTHACKDCGVCLREYFATIVRMGH
jgi:hypothetical protein